jgi:hypothetical protein
MGSVLTRWSGSAWVSPTSVQVWNGSAWVTGAVNAWDGTQWVPEDGGTGPPPPPSPPEFVASTKNFVNGLSLNMDKPAGATLVALMAWHVGSQTMAAPTGWTLVDSAATNAAGAAVFTAPGDVTNTTFTVNGGTPKISGVILGYTESAVAAHSFGIRSGVVNTATAPSATVAAWDAPSTPVRLFWEKCASTTGNAVASYSPATTERVHQDSTGAGCSATGAEDPSPATGGATGAVTATYQTGSTNSSANGGGFTVVLSSTSLQ